MSEFNANRFLSEVFPNLHTSEPVTNAVERAKVHGVPVDVNKKTAQIETYLNRLVELDNLPNQKKETAFQKLSELIIPQVVIKEEDIPNSYFENQKRIARERGYGQIEITEANRELLASEIINDQGKSYLRWFTYLSSEKNYPTWFKYYVLYSVSKLAPFDKERARFPKRDKSTVAIFPDLNQQALSKVLDFLISPPDQEINLELKELLQKRNFADLYAYAICGVQRLSKELKEITTGEWIKYNQGEDSTPLHESLQGYATGWCTAGEAMAEAQLRAGDFYVYYSKDEKNQNKIPRIAIRMEAGEVAEVRGINKDQNLESNMIEIAREKYMRLPGGENFNKKDSDMKRLTVIEKKIHANEELTKEELIFLYEINEEIDGFGYEKDPRITELRATRDYKHDAPTVFSCSASEIAWSEKEINSDTKAYIGFVFPELFTHDFKYLYSSFPEVRIHNYSITLGAKNKDMYFEEINARELPCGFGRRAFADETFHSSNQEEVVNLVFVTGSTLGCKLFTSNEEMLKKAAAYGLKPCPAEVGLALHLYFGQRDKSFHVVMTPITYFTEELAPKAGTIIKQYPQIFCRNGKDLETDFPDMPVSASTLFVFEKP